MVHVMSGLFFVVFSNLWVFRPALGIARVSGVMKFSPPPKKNLVDFLSVGHNWKWFKWIE